MTQDQDRRLKPIEQDEDQKQRQQQQQKCPRCESLNTKFCYYNNYSLSQPRYFCKNCRRYWTLGGTLRSVPVGGGCRKGKRGKTSASSSSSGENSRSQSQPQLNLTAPENVTSTSPALGSKELLGNSASSAVVPSYYPGEGFFTSLAAFQPSSTDQTPQGFSHQPPYPLNLGGHLNGSLNLGLLHGFSAVPSVGSQQNHQAQQPSQLYHMGDGEDKSMSHPFHPHEESLVQTSTPVTASQQQRNWHQHGFIANSNPTILDTSLWSICTSTAAGNSSSTNAPSGSNSLNPGHQWHDISGYGPLP